LRKGSAESTLANICINRFLKHWQLTERGEVVRAQVVSYADDFVIVSRGQAAEALTWTKAVMTKLGLTLNEAKTSLKDARHERFDFLGYLLAPSHPAHPRLYRPRRSNRDGWTASFHLPGQQRPQLQCPLPRNC
jgi:hypothetical protein